MAATTETEKEEFKKMKFVENENGNFGANFGAAASTSKTPNKEAVRKASAGPKTRNDPSASPLAHIKRKPVRKQFSRTELDLLKRFTAMPHIFPVLYSCELQGEGVISFEFEELEPLEEEGCLVSTILHCDHPVDSLFACIKFAIQLLYGVHILHNDIKVVNSSISHLIVGYSTLHKTWKLTDFNQNLPIEEFLSTSRTAGTFKYIAPESKSSGIFTFQSDIFSLGKVFEHFPLAVLIKQILMNGRFEDSCFSSDSEIERSDSESDGNDSKGDYTKHVSLDIQVRSVVKEFSNLVYQMINRDPENRPAIKVLLKEFFNLLELFEYDESEDILHAVKFIVNDYIPESKLIESDPPVESLKRMKLGDEKDTMISRNQIIR